jgi:gmma-aminobutyric acid receptor subunit gamma/cGMP-dependent protein kinase 2
MFQDNHRSHYAQECLDNLPNNYRPIALTSVAIKFLERLVKADINTIIPDTLDSLQFAHCPKRFTDDLISRNTYVRMLFIDYSAAFNSIVPSKIITKLRTLVLKMRAQVLRVGNNTSTTLTLNMGAPQRCVLSPLLYSLFTHNCVAAHDSNTIIKFPDDTMVVGLITDEDETAYREEVRDLSVWCQDNNLSLNVSKTKLLIVEYRKQRLHQPLIWQRPQGAIEGNAYGPVHHWGQAPCHP